MVCQKKNLQHAPKYPWTTTNCDWNSLSQIILRKNIHCRRCFKYYTHRARNHKRIKKHWRSRIFQRVFLWIQKVLGWKISGKHTKTSQLWINHIEMMYFYHSFSKDAWFVSWFHISLWCLCFNHSLNKNIFFVLNQTNYACWLVLYHYNL